MDDEDVRFRLYPEEDRWCWPFDESLVDIVFLSGVIVLYSQLCCTWMQTGGCKYPGNVKP